MCRLQRCPAHPAADARRYDNRHDGKPRFPPVVRRKSTRPAAAFPLGLRKPSAAFPSQRHGEATGIISTQCASIRRFVRLIVVLMFLVLLTATYRTIRKVWRSLQDAPATRLHLSEVSEHALTTPLPCAQSPQGLQSWQAENRQKAPQRNATALPLPQRTPLALPPLTAVLSPLSLSPANPVTEGEGDHGHAPHVQRSCGQRRPPGSSGGPATLPREADYDDRDRLGDGAV